MNDFRKGFIIFLILIAMVSISEISAADNNIGSVSSNYENNIVTDGEVPISEDTSFGDDYAIHKRILILLLILLKLEPLFLLQQLIVQNLMKKPRLVHK
jgi:hypothetical protein